jgi:hypothetical protein
MVGGLAGELTCPFVGKPFGKVRVLKSKVEWRFFDFKIGSIHIL